MLVSTLSGHWQDNVVYIVVHRVSQESVLDILMECLRQELGRKIHKVETNTVLEPGQLYFLSGQHHFQIKDRLLTADPSLEGRGRHLDILFTSVAAENHKTTVIILSGLILDEDGVAGLRLLKSKGSRVIGSQPAYTPVSDMIERFTQAGVMDELYHPNNLLEQLHFENAPLPKAPIAKFLVVDDENQIRQTIRDLLRSESIDCDIAVDGLDALRKVQKNRYSAILLDLRMPEMDGMKTLEALIVIDPELPVLIVTGSTDRAKLDALRHPNVKGILLKPFTLEDLKKYLPALKSGKDPNHG